MMKQHLTTVLPKAKEVLLSPTGLTEKDLEHFLSAAMSKQIDYADLYFQLAIAESFALEQGLVKEAGYHIAKGVGVRATSGAKSALAYSESLDRSSIIEAAKSVRSLGSTNTKKIPAPLESIEEIARYYGAQNPLSDYEESEKVKWLKKVDKLAREIDPRIIQVKASLAASYEIILIASSSSVFTADIRPLVRFSLSAIAAEGKRLECGYSGCGGRFGYALLLTEDILHRQVERAVHRALLNLKANDAPAGEMPVVLGPGWPAVLLHEAIGHGLEGDGARKKTSFYADKIGERVASTACSVVDDGTRPNLRGSLNIDDEGTPTQATMLIEKGILKGYLYDTLNARLMNTVSTGNGRRESYSAIPIPRMTNTFLMAGPYDPQEIMESVKRGIYAAHFSGGEVDITSGKFVFSADEAYLIENGKITAPIKEVSFIGEGPEILNRVTMVGSNLQFDEGIGTCGKEGQSVPVGLGQPTVKIDKITVGGTQAE